MALRSGLVCAHCKKWGHVLSECWALKKKGNALVTTGGCSSSGQESKTPNTFRPLISKELIMTDRNRAKMKEIQILCDTGASQWLLAGGVLELTEQSTTGKTVLIHGVELGFYCVPLHRVFLQSDLVAGPIIVGVRPTLPVEGVSLLLGNDLAGNKVMVDPCLSRFPYVSDSTSWETPGLFPACAVTCVMAKQAEKQSLLLANDQAKSHIVDISDTFLANDHVHDNTFTDDHTSDASLKCPVPTSQLMEHQKSDLELVPLLEDKLCEFEAAKVPSCFYMKSGILMRK